MGLTALLLEYAVLVPSKAWRVFAHNVPYDAPPSTDPCMFKVPFPVEVPRFRNRNIYVLNADDDKPVMISEADAVAVNVITGVIVGGASYLFADLTGKPKALGILVRAAERRHLQRRTSRRRGDAHAGIQRKRGG